MPHRINRDKCDEVWARYVKVGACIASIRLKSTAPFMADACRISLLNVDMVPETTLLECLCRAESCSQNFGPLIAKSQFRQSHNHDISGK